MPLWLAYLQYQTDCEEAPDTTFMPIGVFESSESALSYARAKELELNQFINHDHGDKHTVAFEAYANATINETPVERIFELREKYLGQANFTSLSYGYRLYITELPGVITPTQARNGRGAALSVVVDRMRHGGEFVMQNSALFSQGTKHVFEVEKQED